jgi:hypothetical protein
VSAPQDFTSLACGLLLECAPSEQRHYQRQDANMLDKEEQWSQTVIAKIVEMFGNPHDCTLADEKAVEKALAAVAGNSIQ